MCSWWACSVRSPTSCSPKLLCRVPRPWVLSTPGFAIVESARAAATGSSFPSGHAQNAVRHVRGHRPSGKAQMGQHRVPRAGPSCAVFADVSGGPHAAGRGRGIPDGGNSARGVLPHFPLGRKNQRCHAVSSRGGHCAWPMLFVFYVSGIRADFAPGSEDASNLAHAVKNAWTLLGAITGLLFGLPCRGRKTLRFETRAPLLGQILKLVLGLALVAGIKAALKPLFYAVLPSGPCRLPALLSRRAAGGDRLGRARSRSGAKLGAKKEA